MAVASLPRSLLTAVHHGSLFFQRIGMRIFRRLGLWQLHARRRVGAVTDLDMRPSKGKVEAKNTGKNVLVRSLSGIGQVGALLLGQGSLNQSLSESDLMRERVSSNIGEASDEEISRMAITSRIRAHRFCRHSDLCGFGADAESGRSFGPI